MLTPLPAPSLVDEPHEGWIGPEFGDAAASLIGPDDLADPVSFERAVGTVLRAATALVPSASTASISYRVERDGEGRGRLHTMCALNHEAAAADALQHSADQGPCVDALEADDENGVVTADLRCDHRWPLLRGEPGSSTTHARSVLVRVPKGHRASMTVYTFAPRRFLEDADAPAQVRAAAQVVSLGLSGLLYRRRADNLQLALNSNRRIGAALGILIVRHRLTYDEALDRMRTLSQSTHRKLHDLADDVLLTGTLPGLK